MKSNILKTITAAFAGCLFFLASTAYGDAPLKSSLDLNLEQAEQVAKIQKETRNAIRPVRGDLHREERALRRAKIENNSDAVAVQEKLIEPLRAKMKELQEIEVMRIKKLLTSEQNAKYDELLKKRNEMAGSSRDVKDTK